MKNSQSIISKIFAVILLVSISASSFASEIKIDRTTEKARTAVENASPDDWYTLAQSAKQCIEKGVNMREASMWLKQSLEIKEDVCNLIIQGDYYMKNRLPEKALESYSKSIRVGLLTNPAYADIDTQMKILDIVKQLG